MVLRNRVDLDRMKRALAAFDEKLQGDAGPMVDYAIDRWWKESESAYRDACETLTAAGCERSSVIWLLMFCDDASVFNCPPFSVPARALDNRIKKIRECRDYLREPDMAHILLEDPVRFESLLSAPDTLDLHISLLRHLTQNLGPKSHCYLDTSKSLLDEYVKEKTGRYYDADVALLISGAHQLSSVASGGKNAAAHEVGTTQPKPRTYSAESHRNWRSSFKKRIVAFKDFDRKMKVEYREEKRVVEECAARRYRGILWDYLWDPHGEHPFLELDRRLAEKLLNGLREGDRIIALNGRPASDWPRSEVARRLNDRASQKRRHLGAPIKVSIRRRADIGLEREITLHLEV